MKRFWLAVLMTALAPLALAGCGKGGHADDGAQQPLRVEKVTNVQVQPVAAADVQETFTLPGTLEAWEDLTLAAELAGAVRWIGPKEGGRLEEGDVILRIDPETAAANLAQEQADYALQQKQLQRMEELLAQKFVSPQEYEEARRAYQMAEASLKRARVALEKSTLRSPVAGVLDRLLVDRGEYVSEGTPVALVVQVDRLKVLVEVPEKDVPFLKSGDRVEVLPAAIQGPAAEERSGDLIHLAYKADPVTRTYLAKVAVDNRSGELRPGMIVRVGLVRRNLEGVIAIPLYAVMDRAGAKVVFVEEDGIARMRPVTLGAVVGDRVVVTAGLSRDENLIVQGQQLITDGAKVRSEESAPRIQVSEAATKPGA